MSNQQPSLPYCAPLWQMSDTRRSYQPPPLRG